MSGEHDNSLKIDSLSQEEQAYVRAFLSGEDAMEAYLESRPGCKNEQDARLERIRLFSIPRIREAIDELLTLQEEANRQQLRALEKEAIKVLQGYMAGGNVAPTQLEAIKDILSWTESPEGQCQADN
jgi:hypothetical protein